jgi:hypothetical protein
MGVIAAVAGIEHGIGEILQGNVRPAGLVIESWPDSAFFSVQAGEPAMTVIPNLLASGILTVLLSLVLAVWAVRSIGTKRSPFSGLLLSVALLLVGGGFGPPVLGIVVSAMAAVVARRPHVGERAQAGRVRVLLARWWGPIYVCFVAAWLMLFPGSNLLGYYFAVDGAAIVPAAFFSAFGLLFLAFISGLARDAPGEAAASELTAARAA